MNPIIAELKRLFSHVELTSSQRRAAERADNPADVAASLKTQAQDIRRMFDNRLGEGVAADADVVARMNLSKAVGGFGSMSLTWLLQPLGPARAFALGRASHFGMRGLYAKHIGTYDPEGAEWWEAAFVEAAKRDGTIK